MNITKVNDVNKVTLLLDGWLDTEAAPLLGQEIETIESAGEIVIDLDKVEYMSSSGLRQILAAHKKAKELEAALTLINVRPEIMNIFKLTGLEKKLSIMAAGAEA